MLPLLLPYCCQAPTQASETFSVGSVLSIDGHKEMASGLEPLALAWLLHQGENIVSIPGTKRRKYLEENAPAVDVTLTEEDLMRIDEVAPKGVAAGEHYNEAFMRTVNR